MNRIRRAAPADSTAVFDLAREFATSFHPQLAAFEQSFLRADRTGSVILGFDRHMLYANGRVAWVEERPDRRRSGVGRDLMQHFGQWGAERGSRLVALPTGRAAPFYAAIGYHESAVYFRKLL